METYTLMRAFADSWGLLAMFVFFVAAVSFVFLRPSARQLAQDAAAIPFKED
jgi:cytochrome c oxidase cbb3-type subunit IV